MEALAAGAFLWRSHMVGKFVDMEPTLAVVLLDHELRATIHSRLEKASQFQRTT